MAASHPIIPGVTFKDVAGLPGYCVGDDGSVWSNRRSNKNLRGGWLRLKPCLRSTGYWCVSLVRGRKRADRSVHRLILETFVGPAPEGCECCHGDDDAANNRLSNLRWDTHRNNVAQREAHGNTAWGEKSGVARLDNRRVAEIREAFAAGESRADLARRYGVGWSTVHRVVSGITWTRLVDDNRQGVEWLPVEFDRGLERCATITLEDL